MQHAKIIHITWDGPYSLEKAQQELTDENKDYGVYQIYGTHPVYGANVLLYIGRTDQQTFWKRISQEQWDTNLDSKTIQIYVGRLGGYEGTPTDDEWVWQINAAERMLIYAHSPAVNCAGLRITFDEEYQDVHILNWEKRRSLYPEVSGLFYSNLYDREKREFVTFTYNK